MSKASSSLLHVIRTMAGAYKSDSRSDVELMSRYIDGRDEVAFATLMVRHGPMVWGICSRILGNAEDVEDAYQVVMLSLANKASKIRIRSLAGWLHHVAQQTALNFRKATRSHKRLHERVKTTGAIQDREDNSPDDAHELLHEELAKLPEKLRTALVLHYLEGKTQAEIASILGVKQPAVGNRLARGKVILQERLKERGLTLGMAVLAEFLAHSSSPGAVPIALVAKTAQAAAELRDGNLSSGLTKLAQEMLKHTASSIAWWKQGWMIAILCAAGLGISAGGVAWKTRFFGVGADSPHSESKSVLQSMEQEKPKQPRLDLYGDPLPSGALARLGTTRLRTAEGLFCAGRPHRLMAFTKDGKQLITDNGGRVLRLLDARSGRLLHKFHGGGPTAISRDGGMVASAGGAGPGSVCIWDSKSGKLERRVDTNKAKGFSSLTISPDGEVLALAEYDEENKIGKIHIWNASVGKRLRTLNLVKGRPIVVLAFSSDGKLLVGVDEKRMHVWDLTLGKEIRRSEEKNKADIISFDYHPELGLAAVGYGKTWDPCEQEGFASIWDSTTGKELAPLMKSKTGVTAIRFAPDGKRLATGDFQGDVRLWNVGDGRELRRYKGCAGEARGMAFSPNGSVLAIGSSGRDQTVHLWDVETGRETTPICKGHRGCIASVAFASNGKDVVSTGADGAYRVWDSDKGMERMARTVVPDASIPVVVTGGVSPDARNLAFGEFRYGEGAWILTTVQRERKTEKEKLFSVRMNGELIRNVAFAADGEILAYRGDQLKEPALVQTSTGKPIGVIAQAGDAVAFSPDGKILAATELNHLGRTEGTIVVRDVRNRAKLCAFSIAENVKDESVNIGCLSFCPDAALLLTRATVGKICQVKLWDLSLALNDPKKPVRCCQVIEVASNAGPALAISPDGRSIATSDAGNNIHVWETVSGKERICFKGHGSRILSLAFSPDSRRLASGGEDTTILIWDVTSRLDRGSLRSAILSACDLDSLWKDLAERNVSRAANAVWTLASAGERAVDFLDRHMRPAARQVVDPEFVAKLIGELDDSSFAMRQKAERKLLDLEKHVEPYVSKALRGKCSAEQRERLGRILTWIRRHYDWSLAVGDEIRGLRAIEVLEQIGSPSARRLLERLAAAGTLEGRSRTHSARAALDRLKGKGPQLN